MVICSLWAFSQVARKLHETRNAMERDKDNQSFLRRWVVIDNLALPPPDYFREFECLQCNGHASELFFPALDLQISYNCNKCTPSKHMILRDDMKVWLVTKGKGPYVAPDMVNDPAIKRWIVIWRRYLTSSATWGTTYKSLFQASGATAEEDARLGEMQLRQRLDLFGSPLIKPFRERIRCRPSGSRTLKCIGEVIQWVRPIYKYTSQTLRLSKRLSQKEGDRDERTQT